MCGIAGFVDPRENPAQRAEAVGRMCAAMLHRGPDDAGVESFAAACVGMRRLAIFDPAHGHQPMRSPDGRLTIVFNGAIYNFRALREQLGASGWEFRTQCDTEVLLAAFAHWGEACLGRLRGMFAFAIWDERDRSLFLARDPFGIKPLYFHQAGQRLLFASEVKALLASGAVAAAIDPHAVSDYLSWLAVPAPRTIYRDIFSLRPGESARFRDGQLEVRAAWTFAAIRRDTRVCSSIEEFTRELRARLEDTIRAHVVADVPVGAFLSGGLDSAVVVGLMTRVTGSRLRTFSIDFADEGYSEAAPAAATARHFGTEHHTTQISGPTVVNDLERILGTFDQPTGDGINTYYASQAARAGGVTVALSGLGGDELFGGYPSFRDVPRLRRWLPAWRALPPFVRRPVMKRLAAGTTRQRKLADFLAHARNRHELGALQRRVFADPARRALLHPDFAAALETTTPFHPELPRLSAELADTGMFETISAWELRTYMADVLLRDSDVMSMRHSLELRVPFVDRPLIEWLWVQREEFKADPTHPKSALGRAMRDLLPPGLEQRKKWGFTVPFAVWMKRELRPFLEDTFTASSVARSGLFAPEAAQELWRGFLNGNDDREWSRVWSLAVMIAFANRRAPRIEARERARAAAQVAAAPQRTLLLAPEIFASEGGIPRILQLYLKALGEMNGGAGAVRLLTLNDQPAHLAHAAEYTNGTLEASFACGRSKLAFTRAALRMSRDCDRLVCGHVAQLPVAWLAKKLHPRLRYYLVAHGIEVWRKFNAAERLALLGAERVFCVSDFTRRELLKNCPLPAGRAVVLHNALHPRFPIRAGRPLADCPPTILVVTRLLAADRYKGVQTMIEAMPEIRAAIPAARLRIVGRGDDLPRLRGIAAQLRIDDAVTFTGFVEDAQLQDELNTCRLFALPSRKEGFGLVFLEAMAHGRPCLGARAGGVPEVISPETGVLVEYGDIAGIAAACTDALQRDWDEAAILARARHFSYDAFRARLTQNLAA